MFGSFEKFLGWFRTSGALQGENQKVNLSKTGLGNSQRELDGEIKDAQPERERLGSEKLSNSAAQPDALTSVPIMLEILKLLARIEYGLDEQQIAEALAISAEVVLANCDALEQEMFIHHHDTLAEWFIGQRGLVFLRLHGDPA
jgi:hypothetical protein